LFPFPADMATAREIGKSKTDFNTLFNPGTHA